MTEPITFKQVASDLPASEQITTNLSQVMDVVQSVQSVQSSAEHGVNRWTLEQFRVIPRTLASVPEGATAAVIIPADPGAELHDSGYQTVTLVFLDHAGVVLGRTQHGHDHLQFFVNKQADDMWTASGAAVGVQAHGYEAVEMDFLPVSGLARVWMGYSGFEARGLLMSSASLRPGKVNKVAVRSDALKDVKRKMLEWKKEFGPEVLAVTLDDVLEHE